jgi:hypothetical protein
MANTFANGLRIAAQKRPRPITQPAIPPITTQPVYPQPVTDAQPAIGLNPRPPTESGFPTPGTNPTTPPITTQPVKQPSLIQDTLRRRRELEI